MNQTVDTHKSDQSHPPDQSESRRIQNAGDAKKELYAAFNDWTAILNAHSLQIAFAIIAANWAVHGDASSILSNWGAKWSMAIVFIFLGVDLFITRLMVGQHDKQYTHAEENEERWNKEYIEGKGNLHWPYTAFITYTGKIYREIKCWAPIIAAFLFIISLFLQRVERIVERIIDFFHLCLCF